jgi:hypothetical protein
MRSVINIPHIALILIFLAGTAGSVHSQESRAKASMDTSRILIGDHVNIFLELNQARDERFEFPVYMDTLVKNVEILSVSPVDTLQIEDRLKLRQNIVVTSFDTGFYVIPSFRFYDRERNDSLISNALPLEVLTIEIDTTKGITDIKMPIDVPLGFREIAPYIIVLLILIAIGLFIWYYYRKKKKRETEPPARIKPAEPAHTWALRELDKLSSEKLWQKGKIKLFHSRLTDIIRTYIEYRFDIPAMEYTTSETVSACRPRKEISEELSTNLESILELADLVKFAKWNPLPDENENSQQLAYDFVFKTKKSEALRKEDDKVDKEEAGDVKDNRNGKEGEDVQ